MSELDPKQDNNAPDKLEPKENTFKEALRHAERVSRHEEQIKLAKETRRKELVGLLKDALDVVEEAAPACDSAQRYVLMMAALQELSKPLEYGPPLDRENVLAGLAEAFKGSVSDVKIIPIAATPKTLQRMPFSVRIRYALRLLRKGTLR